MEIVDRLLVSFSEHGFCTLKVPNLHSPAFQDEHPYQSDNLETGVVPIKVPPR